MHHHLNGEFVVTFFILKLEKVKSNKEVNNKNRKKWITIDLRHHNRYAFLKTWSLITLN
jgi:hypothetical protein